MKRFSNFLAEMTQDDEKQLKHLEHAEDHPLNAGHEGVVHALANLRDVHRKLRGRDVPTKITTKMDGSPSVVFGYHPVTGKFFVGSKSVFNKNPKVNYTPEDIQKNHGHAPGLVEKLKAALKHLPKVTPKQGIFQGDIMHTKHDVHVDKDKVHFTPNTITYSVPKDSPHGQAALKSHIGIAVHTAYKGDDLENMRAHYAPSLSSFRNHGDVHLISTEHDLSKVKYTPKAQTQFRDNYKKAVETAKDTDENTWKAVGRHTIPLKTYINATVRHGTTPSFNGFVDHYKSAHMKKVDSVSSAKAKAAKTEAMNKDLADVTANRHHFDKALALHKHLQKAKNVVTNTLSSGSEFDHSIRGKKSKPEGFVTVRNNRPTKFVDRKEFSAANFNRDKAL